MQLSREEMVDAITAVWRRSSGSGFLQEDSQERKMREKRADPELAKRTNQLSVRGFFGVM